jgi:hypothetical protein
MGLFSMFNYIHYFAVHFLWKMSRESQTSEQLTSSQVLLPVVAARHNAGRNVRFRFFWTPNEEATRSGIANRQTPGSENNLHQSVTEGGGK